jgi:FkbM family methyltransferase
MSSNNLKELKNYYSINELSKEEFIERIHEIHKLLFEYSEFIKYTDIKKIEIEDNIVFMISRESDVKMICDQDDHRTIPLEILNFGSYEKKDLDMILKLIEEGYYCFDIGANIGWYSINISKKVNDVKIFAFEPIPKTFDYLKKNIKINNLSNVKSFNFGFSDEENEQIFYYYPEGPGNASLTNLSGRDNIKEISCLVKKFDDFVLDEDLHVDFIKCDVEGAELFVFKGGLKTIERDKPIIFTELLRKWSSKFKYHPNDVIKLLENIGYKCFFISNENLIEIPEINVSTVETNFVFLHQEKHINHITDLVKKDLKII